MCAIIPLCVGVGVVQSQEKLEVWDIEAERSPLLCSFKAHIRPVT